MALEHLRAAVAALEADEPARALEPLLAAWRALPLDALAAAVQAVSQRASKDRTLDAAEGHHRAWLALAVRGDAADVGGLLRTLAGGAAEAMRERVEVLAQRDADPRVEAAFLAWLSAPTLSGRAGQPVALAMLEHLGRTRSPTTAAAVAALGQGPLARLGAAVRQRLERAARAVDGTAPPPPPAPLAPLLDAVLRLAKPEAPAAAEGELLAAVRARPAEDGPRLVYADWLLERGDPRGELIVLQCQRARASAPVSSRERELLRTHAAQWLEPVSRLLVKKHTAFERGFLASCGVSLKWAEDRALLAHPIFSTVTRFDVRDVGPAWLDERVCDAVEAVTGLYMHQLDQLKRQVRHLGLRGFDTLERLPLLKEQQRLESLEIVGVPAALDWAASTLRPWLPPSVEHFTLDGTRFSR